MQRLQSLVVELSGPINDSVKNLEGGMQVRQQMLSAEKAHSEALSKEMSQLAEHAREMEKAAQQQQMAAMEATREKDAIGKHKEELNTIESAMKDLKAKLYGKFGTSINLEE